MKQAVLVINLLGKESTQEISEIAAPSDKAPVFYHSFEYLNTSFVVGLRCENRDDRRK